MHAFIFNVFPSCLFSRVLGDELRRLRTLSVWYCGLEDLDGISYVPNIVSLCAADNHISDVYPVTELRKIHTLDLEKYKTYFITHSWIISFARCSTVAAHL